MTNWYELSPCLPVVSMETEATHSPATDGNLSRELIENANLNLDSYPGKSQCKSRQGRGRWNIICVPTGCWGPVWWRSSGPHQVECPPAVRLASLYQACSFIKASASSDPAHTEQPPGEHKQRRTHGSHRSVWKFDSIIDPIWIRV